MIDDFFDFVSTTLDCGSSSSSRDCCNNGRINDKPKRFPAKKHDKNDATAVSSSFCISKHDINDNKKKLETKNSAIMDQFKPSFSSSSSSLSLHKRCTEEQPEEQEIDERQHPNHVRFKDNHDENIIYCDKLSEKEASDIWYKLSDFQEFYTQNSQTAKMAKSNIDWALLQNSNSDDKNTNATVDCKKKALDILLARKKETTEEKEKQEGCCFRGLEHMIESKAKTRYEEEYKRLYVDRILFMQRVPDIANDPNRFSSIASSYSHRHQILARELAKEDEKMAFQYYKQSVEDEEHFFDMVCYWEQLQREQEEQEQQEKMKKKKRNQPQRSQRERQSDQDQNRNKLSPPRQQQREQQEESQLHDSAEEKGRDQQSEKHSKQKQATKEDYELEEDLDNPVATEKLEKQEKENKYGAEHAAKGAKEPLELKLEERQQLQEKQEEQKEQREQSQGQQVKIGEQENE